ncbi:hypothetical protein AFCA_000047 [Aspergillus flavus]|nr:hypothetical protein AFCA_000047 [Aspergillus flavus]
MDLGGMCSVCPYRGSNVGKFMCRVKRVALEHVADRLVCRALLFASDFSTGNVWPSYSIPTRQTATDFDWQ